MRPFFLAFSKSLADRDPESTLGQSWHENRHKVSFHSPKFCLFSAEVRTSMAMDNSLQRVCALRFGRRCQMLAS